MLLERNTLFRSNSLSYAAVSLTIKNIKYINLHFSASFTPDYTHGIGGFEERSDVSLCFIDSYRLFNLLSVGSKSNSK